MTQAARVYGGSLYDLATEEKLDGQIMEQMNEIRQIFRENPEYLKLLGEPAIPQEERIKMLDEAFGGQVELYLLNFLKLLCEKKILREFAGCCEEFTQRYNTRPRNCGSGSHRRSEIKRRPDGSAERQT